MPAGRQVGNGPRSLLPQVDPSEDTHCGKALFRQAEKQIGKGSGGPKRAGGGTRRWRLSQNLLRKQANGRPWDRQSQLL